LALSFSFFSFFSCAHQQPFVAHQQAVAQTQKRPTPKAQIDTRRSLSGAPLAPGARLLLLLLAVLAVLVLLLLLLRVRQEA
jgi:hypothetical protein